VVRQRKGPRPLATRAADARQHAGQIVAALEAVGIEFIEALMKRTDPYFRSFDDKLPDFFRYLEWAREFDDFVKNKSLPSLTLLRLMNDHTGAFAQAIRGVNTPELQVADNDYAVGLVVDKVAHSPYAASTLIFVVEDDAQDGPDHIDAHRSIALVAGPFPQSAQLRLSDNDFFCRYACGVSRYFTASGKFSDSLAGSRMTHMIDKPSPPFRRLNLFWQHLPTDTLRVIA
jgi:hypothetical protein